LKGTPENPNDGYQKRAVEYLKKAYVRYTHFDVMQDADVREMVKEFSQVSSFP